MNDASSDVGSQRPVARATRRPSTNFDAYVLVYSNHQRRNAFLIFAGIPLALGGGIYLEAALQILFVAVGIGVSGAGATGLLTAAAAHTSFTRHLADITTEAYAEAPPTETLRPFMPSRNGTNSTTIRAGRFILPAATWAELFASADNEGRLTRDGVVRVLPRAIYRDWKKTMGELQRLGLVADDGRVVVAAWERLLGEPPHPNGVETAAGAHSTHARRTNGAHGEKREPVGS